jgi:hypothetical protein
VHYTLRHKGDKWYWTGDGWTDKPWLVKKFYHSEAKEWAEHLAALATGLSRFDSAPPVVDIISADDMLEDLNDPSRNNSGQSSQGEV